MKPNVVSEEHAARQAREMLHLSSPQMESCMLTPSPQSGICGIAETKRICFREL